MRIGMLPLPWILLLQLSFVFVRGYEHGFDGWYQPVPHRPVDIITDVINDLGVRILQQYTAHGNVAFSPTGVGFVLAALYEGSAGRGSQQISDALGLPRDRDITRIGFRDVHRRLRTYLNADGFLGGLTLNQENTKLRPRYEDVLRFYGFDLSADGGGETKNETTPRAETTTTLAETDQSSREDETTTSIDEGAGTPATSTEFDNTEETPTTTLSSAELLGTTLNTLNMQDRLTQSTSTASTILTSTILTSTILSSTFSDATTTTETNLSTEGTDSTFATTLSPRNNETLMINGTETQDTTMMGINGTDFFDSNSTASLNASTPMNVNSSSIDSMNSTTPSTSNDAMEGTTILPMDSMNATEQNSTESSQMNSTESNQTTNATTGGTQPDENTVSTDPATNSSQMGSTDLPNDLQSSTVSSTTDVSMNQVRRRSVRSPRGYFSSYPDEGIWMQDLGIWKTYSPNLSEASVRDSTEISFLVNGCDVSSVTASRYIAVLPFAYFPSLHAVALEFPLDDPRYNILLLMATDRRDTYRLTRDLGGKSLRLLRKQLQPTWVRATIPSFMLRGFVTLTSFLQRLGIMDVFEPRTADLSPMTPDLGVYARDVQQSIGVNIRNYMRPDRTHSRNGLFERAGPVPFTAVHPFLYFIVDAETSVALIAGRVNDPLNSRIL